MDIPNGTFDYRGKKDYFRSVGDTSYVVRRLDLAREDGVTIIELLSESNVKWIQTLEIQSKEHFPPIIKINGKELSPDEYAIEGRMLTLKKGCR